MKHMTDVAVTAVFWRITVCHGH